MTTALTTTTSRANEIYSKIDNPMLAIAELGKMFHQSAIMGVSTPGDGAVLALTCMCEGITPLEFARTYHIINGRPSMRADMMHAKFRQAGGKVRWLNHADDMKTAEAEFTFDGQALLVKYTIDDARNVVGDKLDKPDSNWRKDRGAMLRARLITKAIRILAPELIAGVYTPDELEDSAVTVSVPPRKSAAERRLELEAEHQQAAATTTTEDIVDVEAVPVTETAAAPVESAPAAAATPEAAPFENDDDAEPVTNETLTELVKLASKISSPETPGSGMTLAEISARICTACKVSKPHEATRGQIRKLIIRFREHLGEK